jgi:outer membrane murein-binding lipoprotein Lpp
MVIVTIFAIAAIAAALGVGFLLGHYTSEATPPDLRSEREKLLAEIEALATELKNATASLSAAQNENDSLTKRVAELTRHYLDQSDRMRAVEQRRHDVEVRARELES